MKVNSKEPPSKREIFEWLKGQGYQTDQGEQEYTMYFELDMPKILETYFTWRVNR